MRFAQTGQDFVILIARIGLYLVSAKSGTKALWT